MIPEAGLDVDFTPNATVFAYMFLISLITGVVFGLAPAIQSTKPEPNGSAKIDSNRPRLSRPHLRNLLVIGQVAVSLVLLIGAGLLVRGLQQAQSTDLGFDQKNLVVVSMDLTTQGYDEARAATFHAQLSERLKALPGIRSVSLAQAVPFTGGRDETIDIEGDGSVNRAWAPTKFRLNTFKPLGYRFGAAGILLKRMLVADSLRQLLARQWPIVSGPPIDRSDDPIAKRFKDSSGQSHEIIGVVADISSRQIGKLDGPFFYTPASPAS